MNGTISGPATAIPVEMTKTTPSTLIIFIVLLLLTTFASLLVTSIVSKNLLSLSIMRVFVHYPFAVRITFVYNLRFELQGHRTARAQAYRVHELIVLTKSAF